MIINNVTFLLCKKLSLLSNTDKRHLELLIIT